MAVKAVIDPNQKAPKGIKSPGQNAAAQNSNNSNSNNNDPEAVKAINQATMPDAPKEAPPKEVGFSGFLAAGYALLTIVSQTLNQGEIFSNATTMHHSHAKSMKDVDPEEYEKITSRPSALKKYLDPIGKALGLEEFDDAYTFYARLWQKAIKPFAKLVQFDTVPFIGPDKFKDKQDLSLDEDGNYKNPKGHIAASVAEINPDVSINATRPILGNGFWKGFKNLMLKLNFPTDGRMAASFMFNWRNNLEVFLHAFKTPKNCGMLGKTINTAKIFTSALASSFAPLGSFMAWVFSFTGNSKLKSASNLWSLIGAIHVIENSCWENLVKFLGAWGTSKKEGISLKEATKEAGLSKSQIFQGIVGGAIAVPATPGFMMRMFQVFKDTRYFFVPAAKEFAKVFHDVGNKLGITRDKDSSNVESWTEAKVKRFAEILRDYGVNSVEKLINFAPIKAIFSKFMATNDKGEISGDVYREILTDISKTGEEGHTDATCDKEKYRNFYGLPTADKEAKDLSKEYDTKNKLFGIIPKSESFMQLYKIFGPFAAWLVCTPFAFTKLSDKNIQEKAIAPFRIFDKGIGLVNKLLALPNFITYGLTARFPQMVAAYYDLKQRKADAQGLKGKDGEAYDVMKENIIPLTEKLINSKIPFASYFGKVLYTDLVKSVYGPDVFKDPEKANKLLTGYQEQKAFYGEYAVEPPVAMRYIRDWMNSLVYKYSFFRNHNYSKSWYGNDYAEQEQMANVVDLNSAKEQKTTTANEMKAAA